MRIALLLAGLSVLSGCACFPHTEGGVPGK
jgi:hypothetical protein